MFSEPGAALNPNFSEMYHDRLFNAMSEELRAGTSVARWQEFGTGWTNRMRDTLELFFYGDSVRNH